MELEKLQQIIAEVLNVDASEVMPGTTFTEDLGADSLDLYQIILGVEDAFDIEIPQEEAENRDGGGCDRSDSESCGVNCFLTEQETVTGQYTITEGDM